MGAATGDLKNQMGVPFPNFKTNWRPLPLFPRRNIPELPVKKFLLNPVKSLLTGMEKQVKMLWKFMTAFTR